MMSKQLTIRQAVEADVPLIYDFIVKMAEYERLSDEVDITPESLRCSMFEHHQAEAVIGEFEGQAVGFALYFYNFSTFKGRHGLYLEDIFVDKEWRGRGFGKRMFMHLVELAVERGCRRMEWVVLDWNKPSIEFYKSLGAVAMSDWSVFRLTEEVMQGLVQSGG